MVNYICLCNTASRILQISDAGLSLRMRLTSCRTKREGNLNSPCCLSVAWHGGRLRSAKHILCWLRSGLITRTWTPSPPVGHVIPAPLTVSLPPFVFQSYVPQQPYLNSHAPMPPWQNPHRRGPPQSYLQSPAPTAIVHIPMPSNWCYAPHMAMPTPQPYPYSHAPMAVPCMAMFPPFLAMCPPPPWPYPLVTPIFLSQRPMWFVRSARQSSWTEERAEEESIILLNFICYL